MKFGWRPKNPVPNQLLSSKEFLTFLDHHKFLHPFPFSSQLIYPEEVLDKQASVVRCSNPWLLQLAKSASTPSGSHQL